MSKCENLGSIGINFFNSAKIGELILSQKNKELILNHLAESAVIEKITIVKSVQETQTQTDD